MNIISQPNNISAAYRPIVFDVNDSTKPPVAYCDIYFNGTYYKTLSKTVPETANTYRFDISDACQEYLSSKLPPINGYNQNIPENHFLECYCKFRTSSINSDGFIQQEIPIPKQATSSTEAVSGGGLSSNTLYILNAVIQHENNQNIVEHLKAYHNYGNDVLVLSHRPENYNICKNDSDYLSVFTNANLKCIKVTVKRNDGSTSVYQKCNYWIGVNMVCLKNSNGQNTGYKNYTTLEMYDWNNQPTGVTKSNTSGTEGYIDPVYDDVSCPLQSEPTTCDAPIINSVTVNNDGRFVIDYIVTTTNLGSPEYEVSTTSDFTTIIHHRIGFTYTNPETTTLSQAGYTSLYFRSRKHCTQPSSGTIPSNWSNVLHWEKSVINTQSFWYQGRWGDGDTLHDPEINSWVKYIDEFGIQQTQIIGPIEWGCQEVVASSIVQTNGVNTCTPNTLHIFAAYINTNTTKDSGLCNSTNGLIGCYENPPVVGSIIRDYAGIPLTGVRFCKIQWGSSTGDTTTYAVSSTTGELLSVTSCN